jgi:hypothetical protein
VSEDHVVLSFLELTLMCPQLLTTEQGFHKFRWRENRRAEDDGEREKAAAKRENEVATGAKHSGRRRVRLGAQAGMPVLLEITATCDRSAI